MLVYSQKSKIKKRLHEKSHTEYWKTFTQAFNIVQNLVATRVLDIADSKCCYLILGKFICNKITQAQLRS